MIGISRLYCGVAEVSDNIRYSRNFAEQTANCHRNPIPKKPVVVWNIGKRCNLRCIHCYSDSQNIENEDELTAEAAEAFIDDAAQFGVPVILFSGGEPLLQPRFYSYARRASLAGIRTVVSTNGTLIDEKVAYDLKEIGLSYVGVSVDGMRRTHDEFRGFNGAFDNALKGIRLCQSAGLKVGLRFTITKHNVKEIPDIFKLLEDENIPRICFYHLVYAGRASTLIDDDLDHAAARATVDLIIDLTAQLHCRGLHKEVLTVDNHADGIYLYLRMVRERNQLAANALELLKINGGNSSGITIGCIGWDGKVHPDQFWRHYTIGNVQKRTFSAIWTDMSDPLMVGLKNRASLLKGRCGRCVWKDVCNGNFRVRAEAIYGDVWAEDPACYLTEEEICTRIEL